MNKFLVFVLTVFFCVVKTHASPTANFNLMVAPGTLAANEVTILWDKQNGKGPTYEIMVNGKLQGITAKTNYAISGLQPHSKYKVTVRVKGSNVMSNTLKIKTPAQSKIYNIIDYGARAETHFKNTTAIQKAIDACSEGGTVYVPKGIFLTGALYLKSNMTLYIEKDAVLQGTRDTTDYLPMYLNRFEGWELKTYASLLNAGKLSRNGSYNVKNLRITGGGTVSGGGDQLGRTMWNTSGERSRGRLICLVNCQDASIDHLTITEPPAWTLHYIYSDNISCHSLRINTYGVHNGDGIDPDSSTDSYIFNCTFDNGDDCVAIKSGKNPEGFYIGKPTKNVRITNCEFIRGHGISIGSEMSGGVSDVLVQDCMAGALLNGMQIKGTKERGGYVKNVTVRDCELLQITIFSKLNYNNDGAAAPEPPTFEHFVFENIDLHKASLNKPVIDINGFADEQHKLRNVVFQDILLPENAKVVINDAAQVMFNNVKTVNGQKPEYVQNNSTGIVQQ